MDRQQAGHSIEVRWVIGAVLFFGCGARTELGAPTRIHDGNDGGTPVPQQLATYTQIACGEHHACALRDDGAVYCWGLDTSGQTSAAPSPSSAPVQVGLASPASAIGLGAYHSCAVVSGGVYCWGDDLVDQINHGGVSTATPIVTGVDGATGICAGYSHTCVSLVNGGVTCWGQNSAGQLGNGSTAYLGVPTGALVAQVTAVARSAGASDHTCALVAGGGVRCWGSNVEGEIGSGSLEPVVSVPHLVLEAGAVDVAVVNFTSCAVMADGSLRCWGDGGQGQLGDGEAHSSDVPVVASVAGVRRVAVGERYTCALREGGEVSCWGTNFDGELGDGTTTSSLTPVIAIESGATDLCAGGGHTCALRDGRVLCWGSGSNGELGATSPTQSSTPIAVAGLP